MKRFLTVAALLCAASANADWFEEIKQSGSDENLYRVLYHMPKGGDLHNHLSGSSYSEWMYDLALAQSEHGYQYYTKVRIENCGEYGTDEFGRNRYLLLFRNIMAIQQLQQRFARQQIILRCQDHGGANLEPHYYLENRGVKTDRCKLEHAIARAQVEAASLRVGQIAYALMLDHNPFRFTRGS